MVSLLLPSTAMLACNFSKEFSIRETAAAGKTPLHKEAANGYVARIEALINGGANVKKDNNGYAPWMRYKYSYKRNPF
ncbi:MAG: ankyrin repeat domain-containing protein [Candidatus Cardinium sp.]|nr:ankyrin repeat domain-containing protein [Candidatus Cardinium sp.]